MRIPSNNPWCGDVLIRYRCRCSLNLNALDPSKFVHDHARFADILCGGRVNWEGWRFVLFLNTFFFLFR